MARTEPERFRIVDATPSSEEVMLRIKRIIDRELP
jgi:thymidylate kinase